MFTTPRYVTLYFCFVGLAAGAIGCGGSAKQVCPPVISADAAGNLSGDAAAKARLDAAANAGTNAAFDAGATARAKVPPTDAELREAAELRAKAKINVDAGRWREALPDLERAFSLSGDVTMLGDLGFALQAAGRLDEAWIALYRFRAEARAAYEPMRVKIDAKLGDLEKQLGGLAIDTDTPGAELIVRGQVVAKLPLATPIFLAPGDVSLIVRAAGKPDFNLRSRVAIGAVARASANLGAVAGVGVGAVGGTLSGVGGTLGKPKGIVGGTLGGVGGALGGVGTPALTPPVPPTPPIWPIVAVTGGAAILGGVLITSLVYSGDYRFDGKLCGKSGANVECPELESDLKLKTTLKGTGILLGSAAVVGVVAYLIIRPKAPDLDCPKVGKAAPLLVRCGVDADGNGAGIGCVGAF